MILTVLYVKLEIFYIISMIMTFSYYISFFTSTNVYQVVTYRKVLLFFMTYLFVGYSNPFNIFRRNLWN